MGLHKHLHRRRRIEGVGGGGGGGVGVGGEEGRKCVLLRWQGGRGRDW
jgi:hypothetical protein